MLGDPSEAELRPNEKVCPITGYTYNAGLPHSPHHESLCNCVGECVTVQSVD